MKRLIAMLGLVVIAAVAMACGGGNQPAPATESAPVAAPAAAQPVDITLKTDPTPARMGENTFEVMVMQGGQPVTDADVSVMLFMPAMPTMKMPEMKNTVSLKHEADGRYRGTGNVMMAGGWDATVMVMRGGQEIGSQKLTLDTK